MKKIFSTKNKINGFTLIELIVSTAIFSIVSLSGFAILITSQKAYDKTANSVNVSENINLVQDVLVKELKYATDYGCVNNNNSSFSSSTIDIYYPKFTDISGDCNAIIFTPHTSSTQRVVYFLENNTELGYNLFRQEFNLSGSIFASGTKYQLNIPDVFIDKLSFKIYGVDSGTIKDTIQPSVEIFLRAVLKLNEDRNGKISTTSISVQSFVSQRLFDL